LFGSVLSFLPTLPVFLQLWGSSGLQLLKIRFQ
uniref:Ovule protein n=1 Tax=Hymenolepis diminuta TaxID=6216 RepID=A0A0R3SBA9_HYMDI